MNQFRVHECPIISAEMNCDQHVNKIPTEVFQQLSDCLRLWGVTEADVPYLDKKHNPNHTVTRWVRESSSNWTSSLVHGLALAKEYQRRFGDRKGKTHKSLLKLRSLRSLDVTEFYDHHDPTPFPLCMDPCFRIDGDVVASYRNFYVKDKSRFARWRWSPAPTWYLEAGGRLN